MSITYVVTKTVEKRVSLEKKEVTAVIEKTMELKLHLEPIKEIFVVFYPVWGKTHMTNLVEAVPPTKRIDDISRIGISKILRALV